MTQRGVTLCAAGHEIGQGHDGDPVSQRMAAEDDKARVAAEGTKARLDSTPCWELFEEKTADYRESVLPSSVTASRTL